MDIYAKQGYPGEADRTGTSPWEPVMGLDMSMSPGTVIRPDMPLGSGPAKSSGQVPSPIPVSRQEMPAGPCPWYQVKRPACTEDDRASDVSPMSMKCPERPSCVKPMKCPERPACEKPVKCPEMPSYVMPAKGPEKPACEKSACKKPSCERPAYEKPACEKPSCERPAYEKPACEKPSYEKRACERPAYVKPACERPACTKPAYEKPSCEKPMYKRPAYEKPACEMPAYEKPACVKPAYEKPSCERPMYKKPACEKPACERPAYEKPACEKPAYTKPMKCPDMSCYKNPDVSPVPAAKAAAECIDKYPIAMAYVPWQCWQEVYSVDVALSMGTIFPDLYKPFTMGGCR